MIEEFERYANNDLNRPLTDSEVSVVDVVRNNNNNALSLYYV